MNLTPLEQDILGDMSQDSHGVGELMSFIRAAHPGSDDAEVFARTRALLASWIGRGWLDLGPAGRERAGLHAVSELLPYLDGYGPEAANFYGDVVLPEVDLTEQAFADVAWLRGAA